MATAEAEGRGAAILDGRVSGAAMASGHDSRPYVESADNSCSDVSTRVRHDILWISFRGTLREEV
jgi:hypothetical protein